MDEKTQPFEKWDHCKGRVGKDMHSLHRLPRKKSLRRDAILPASKSGRRGFLMSSMMSSCTPLMQMPSLEAWIEEYVVGGPFSNTSFYDIFP